MRKTWRRIFGTAALAAMLCLAGLVLSGTAFADRCVDNGDGTVTDNGTGLMWQKATAGPMDWNAAMSYASSLSLGGHSGWGLPNKDELSGLYRSPCTNKMNVESSTYWSSTNLAFYTRYAWRFDFFIGTAGDSLKSWAYYVRAVRAEQ